MAGVPDADAPPFPPSARSADQPADPRPRFLTADWLNLAVLSFDVDPDALARHVPPGCELDLSRGRALASVVAFQFFDTRVLGVPVPFHRRCVEVNLRFYVRHRRATGWRHGTVFVKELVPRRAAAWVARAVYNESYVALPMRHEVRLASPDAASRVAYEWRRDGAWEGVWAEFSGAPCFPPDEAEETFVTEHYWGYKAQRRGPTLEYQVEHPRWRVWRATAAALSCDAGALYGPEFVHALAQPPSTAFVADGSRVIVRRGSRV